MAKATRAKENQETPKKRSRKTNPVEGNGADVAQPVTTAPAIANTTSEMRSAEVPVMHSREANAIPEELVRRRAYELYLQRRGQGGSPEQDWFQALQDISGQHVA